MDATKIRAALESGCKATNRPTVSVQVTDVISALADSQAPTARELLAVAEKTHAERPPQKGQCALMTVSRIELLEALNPAAKTAETKKK